MRSHTVGVQVCSFSNLRATVPTVVAPVLREGSNSWDSLQIFETHQMVRMLIDYDSLSCPLAGHALELLFLREWNEMKT